MIHTLLQIQTFSLCFTLFTILFKAKSGVTRFHPSLLSCPLHPRVCGYVHCLARYTLGYVVMFTVMPVTPWGFLVMFTVMPCTSLGFLVMFTVLPVTPQGFWLCQASRMPHRMVSYCVHHWIMSVTPLGFWLGALCCTLHSQYFHWTSLFTVRFLIMTRFCACTPTVQNCIGEGFSHQGDIAVDLRLLLSSSWIQSSFVLLPAGVNETLKWFNQSLGE